MNNLLAKKLKKMAVVDQRMRRQAAKTGKWDFSIDRGNAVKLKKIIVRYGWPIISLVGKKASFSAWLIVQHADHDRPFQKRTLKLLRKIYSQNPKEVYPAHIAFLTDRLLAAEKKKQIFGTQFYWNKKRRLSPYPIIDRKNLDKRRKEYKLPPFRQYKKMLNHVRQFRSKIINN